MAGARPSESSGLLDRNIQNPSASKSSSCQQILVNIALLLNGINIGMNVGLLGPSLPDLAKLTGSTIPEMSAVFVFSSIAYMVGSLLSGFAVGRFEGFLLISFTLILQAVTTAIAPWCANLPLVTLFISLSYFFSTTNIAGVAYLCFRLERKRARVMTQAVFLLFNLGKAIVPLVLGPFLDPETVEVTDPRIPPWLRGLLPRRQTTTKRPPHGRRDFEFPAILSQGNISGFGELIGTKSLREGEAVHSHVGYGYAIVAGFSLLLSALCMVVAFGNGFHLWVSSEERRENKNIDKMPTANISAATSRVRKAAVLLSFFFMIFLQCGMESVDAGLMMSFISTYLGRGKAMGVMASALYQGTKVVACGVVVLTVKYIHPSLLLLIDLIFILVATTLMAATLQFHIGDALLWTTFVLLAIGMSNSYATLASWLETRYRITGGVTALLTISFGLGAMVLPTLTTILLDKYSPIVFPLVLLCCSILCFITYIGTKVLMRQGCCPKVDLTQDDASTVTDVSDGEQWPQLDGATSDILGRGTTYGEEEKQRPQAPRCSKLNPDQYHHAYHSQSSIRPSAPSEHTVLYGSS